MQGKTLSTPQKRGKFLAELRRSANVTRAAALIGAHRSTVYVWRDNDEDFAREWDHACEAYAEDVLEKEADRRAIQGVHHRTYFDKDGKNIGEERRYSDTLLIFRLKGLKPKVYKDIASGVVEHKHSGTVQHTVTLDQRLALAHAALEERRNGHHHAGTTR